jgi:hypothetical protein
VKKVKPKWRNKKRVKLSKRMNNPRKIFNKYWKKTYLRSIKKLSNMRKKKIYSKTTHR